MKNPTKNRAAVSLGRRGGKARAARMTPQQRSAAARKAVEVRWRNAARNREGALVEPKAARIPRKDEK